MIHWYWLPIALAFFLTDAWKIVAFIIWFTIVMCRRVFIVTLFTQGVWSR